MNYIDYILLVPILWGGFRGFKNGLISEGGTVLALVLGIWISIRFSNSFGEYISQYFTLSEQYREVVAFTILFIGVIIICFLITRLLVRFFKAIKLQWLDTLLGILFGALKYVIVLAFVCFVIHTLTIRYASKPIESTQQSLLFKPLAHSAESLLEGSIVLPIPQAADSLIIKTKESLSF
ncbi:MAG TPA: CvpA family protein [Bacteroidales bacterium]|nr:MAG: colicin V production protein [Bacteroidetes bacterium ADurb.Bin217]HPM13507.1 CvpA family protein [Bacteroidales bacterium]